jgi:erythromycin esterase-like protein
MDAMTTDAGFASILESARVMGGFEMMIWMVEENRMLLDELRAWNAEAEAGDRVEIIGIDVQSAHGAAQRLQELLEHTLPELALEAGAVAEQLVQARNAAYGRDLKGIAPAQKRLAAFIAELSQRWGEIALRTSRATPTKSCVARASSLAFRSILRCATMA